MNLKNIGKIMGKKSSVENHFALKTIRFFMSIVGMWPAKNSHDLLLSDLALLYTFVMVIVALIVQFYDLYYSWGDLHAVSYNAPTTFIAVIEFIKLTKFVNNRHEVMNFNAYTEEAFWKIQYEAAELKILNKCNRQSLKIVAIHFFCVQYIVCMYSSIAIVESAGKNSSERILPFNLYFDLPLTKTPYYEIAFSLEVASAMGVGICTTCFSGFLCTTNLYAAGQFKILQRRLQLACGINDVNDKFPIISTYTFLRNCIKQHQALIIYMDRVENLFSAIMLVQTLGSVLEICFCGFQILLGVNSSILRTLLSVQYFIGMIVQLLLFAWSSHEIIIESQEIAEAAYQATWHGLPYDDEGRKCRQLLLVIIARARKPCILTVGKFAPMSLNTFTSVFNTSISYFTILRQMNEEMEK